MKSFKFRVPHSSLRTHLSPMRIHGRSDDPYTYHYETGEQFPSPMSIHGHSDLFLQLDRPWFVHVSVPDEDSRPF